MESFGEVGSRQLVVKTRHKLSLDVDKELFDSFFSDEAFVAWAGGDRLWQLHVFGAPGCGKTTLSCLIAAHLRESTPYDVATLFVETQDNRDARDAALCVNDILSNILDQLRVDEHSPQKRVDRHESKLAGINTIRDTSYQLLSLLRVQLNRSPATFLIVDGVDQLPRSTQDDLFEILKVLGSRLKVLLTRRTPAFQPYDHFDHECDGCECNLGNLSWRCGLCGMGGTDGSFDVCYSCKRKGIWCKLPGHHNKLLEPYDHVEVEIKHDGPNLELFAVRDLEREYGVYKAPLDQGMIQEFSIAQSKAQSIINKSRSDLAITKFRLDQVRETGSFETASTVSDRLPRGIVALYDSELEYIEAMTKEERELILVTLFLVTAYDGIHINELEKALAYFAGTSKDWTGVDYPYVRNMLDLARGLIVQEAEYWSIYPYHADFTLYVREGYNKDIARCKFIVERYEQREQFEIAKGYASEPSYFEIDVSPKNDLQSPGLDLTKCSTSPPSVLSRQSSTGSTDSGYFSSSPSPKIKPGMSPAPIVQGIQKPLQAILEHETECQVSAVRSLCIFCQQTILQSLATSGYHHRLIAQLEIAASQGCPFCSHIYALTKECAKIKKSKNQAPHGCPRRYWTLRTTGKSSSGRDVCVITFQMAIAKGEQCSVQSKSSRKRFFLVAETDMRPIPTVDMLRQSTQLKDAGEQIVSWIQDCDENHPGCEYRSTDNFVPTRLVDIGGEDPSMVKVVETKKNGITRPYVTLSHCWGIQIFLTLRRINEKTLTTEGVRISELTRNFQEAIQVARFIGMRYIWIDSLCIVQGEDGDFQTEGQYMHKVYRFSYCNIVAADSPDSTYGLFRNRDAKGILPATYEAGDDSSLEKGTWRILDEDLWQNELLETPIYTRGWVFQERMLSPRILHFTKHQLYWDCSTISACEALPSGMPFSLDRFAATDRHWRGRLQETADSSQIGPVSGANDDSMENFWKTALLKYTECNLTNQGDKAVAIWSIAKLVRDQLARDQLVREQRFHIPQGPVDEYGGGLWSVALEEQLAWRARDILEGARLEDLQAGNPSWSWTSVKGAIIAQDRLTPERCYAAHNHTGGDVRFYVEDLGGNRDEMPMLKEPFSIDMSAYLEEARVIEDTDRSGTFRLEIIPSQDLVTSHGDEIFQVYPDQNLNLTPASSLGCHLVILAASNDHSFTHSGIDEPTHYSGIGLVLETYLGFKARQRTLFKEVLREFFKKSFEVSTGRWSRDNSVRRVANLGKLLKRDKLYDAGPHFRRIGAVHFRNVSGKTWQAIEGHGRTRFWLD